MELTDKDREMLWKARDIYRAEPRTPDQYILIKCFSYVEVQLFKGYVEANFPDVRIEYSWYVFGADGEPTRRKHTNDGDK